MLKLKPWQLEPVQFEDCLAHLDGRPTARLVVSRDLPELGRLVDEICHLRGSYLVTGYRGVGKTSFVNFALAEACQKLSTQDPPALLIPVRLSLARNYDKVEKLLRRVIRRLYAAVVDMGAYSGLPSVLQTELDTAFQKTSAKVSEAASEAFKTVIGQSTAVEKKIEAGVSKETGITQPLLNKLGASLSGTYSHTHTQSQSEEQARQTINTLEYLEYDDEIAEAELARLINDLAYARVTEKHLEKQPLARRFPPLWKFLGWLLRRDFLHDIVERVTERRLHVVFVFDELDKTEPATAREILKSLKELLLTSDATFIFIGGEEFASQWLGRASPEGDVLYGLFTDIVYVPLYDEDEFDLLASNLIVEPTGGEFPSELLEHLKLHCYGIPREFFRQLLPFVAWQDRQPCLDWPTTKEIYPRAFASVHSVNAQIPGTLPSEVRDDLRRRTDRWLKNAEGRGEFYGKNLYDPERIEASIQGGYWQRQIEGHFDRFLEQMLTAEVFTQPDPDSPDRYWFNPEFTLGYWFVAHRVAPLAVAERPVEAVSKRLAEETSVPLVGGVPLSIPFQAPPRLTTFVDREALLRAAAQALEARSQVVQITGMGGIGKTVLATEIAHLMRDSFPDGILWIDGRAHTTPDTALRHIAAGYGQTLVSIELEEVSSQIRSLLATKRSLLVLDGIEGWSTKDIDLLLPGTRECQLLVTSRRRFPTLERLGEAIALDVLTPESSLALLRKALGYHRSLTQDQAAQELCLLLGYHPLAVDIAGRIARSEGWELSDLARKLKQTGKRLEELELPMAESSDASVTMAFSLSYDRLSDPQKRVFRSISVFAGGFTSDAVAALVNDEIQGTTEALDDFVTVSLLSRSQDSRYYLHPLLRDYALTLAMQADELDILRHRHARYFLKLARSAQGVSV